MDFKERMKSHHNNIKGSCLARYSDDEDGQSSDSEQEKFDEGGIPLYDLQS